jgi:hypothetical protein
MDDASTNFYFDQFPFTAKAGYGPSDYDARHNFKLWGLWTPQIFKDRQSWEEKVIGGWTISGIWNVHSGFPWTPVYNVIVSADPNTCSLIFANSGYCTLRPAAYLGGAGTNYGNAAIESGPTSANPTARNQNFSKGADAYFAPPTLSTTAIPPAPGVARNSFRGPRYSSVDFTLAKAFGLPAAKVIGENAKLEIRANFYNLFNQVNLGPLGNQTIGNIILNSNGTQTNPVTGTPNGPNGSFGQAQFGLAGRVIEGQARFSF